MPRQAIEQAECTQCNESEDNYTVLDSNINSEENSIVYDVRCTCGELASISIGEDGIGSSKSVSYEGASWNQEESDE